MSGDNKRSECGGRLQHLTQVAHLPAASVIEVRQDIHSNRIHRRARLGPQVTIWSPSMPRISEVCGSWSMMVHIPDCLFSLKMWLTSVRGLVWYCTLTYTLPFGSS